MKTLGVILMISGAVATARAETFTGTITDTMCGPKHTMMKTQPDDQCVKMCAKGQYSYALFDGTKVLKLNDQKTAAKFAAKKVTVNGTLDPKTNTIRVASVEAADQK